MQFIEPHVKILKQNDFGLKKKLADKINNLRYDFWLHNIWKSEQTDL